MFVQTMKTFKSAPLTVLLLEIVNSLPLGLRGRGRLQNWIRKKVRRDFYCFPWLMENGNRIGISNLDASSRHGVGATCFVQRSWEPPVESVIRKLLQSGHVALDIGANIGYFSAVMAKTVGPNGLTIAFEPTPETAVQLALTKAATQLDNLKIFECGLGAEAGGMTIFYDPSLSGNASLYERSGAAKALKKEIQIESLDTLFEQKKIPLCQFIKMDAEGHEMEIIKGGLNYLRSSSPSILYEFNADTASLAGYTLKQFSAAINEINPNYVHYLIWNDGHLLKVDLSALMVPAKCHIDLIAIPEEETTTAVD